MGEIMTKEVGELWKNKGRANMRSGGQLMKEEVRKCRGN